MIQHLRCSFTTLGKVLPRGKFLIISRIENFKTLLSEYSLQAYYNDFLFLAFHFLYLKETLERWEAKKPSGWDKELLYSLKFLSDYGKDLKIVIKHKTQNLSTQINNQMLIQNIKDALLSVYVNEIYVLNSFKNPNNIRDWENHIELVIANKKVYSWKKGRKRKHQYLRKFIYALQLYIQKYTIMEAGKSVSYRNQNFFIYRFLNLFELIPFELNWKEDNINNILDNIRLILKKDRQLKSRRLIWVECKNK